MGFETKNFLEISQKLGANAAYIQGAGGNTSLKSADGRMLIKASGYQLNEIKEGFGLADVDHLAISCALKAPNITDRRYQTLITKSNRCSIYPPSMETGMHAVLDDCVLHTHSVYANVLLCCKEGSDLLSALFPTASTIPYVRPGKDLSLKIMHSNCREIVFLQNHGLIVAAKTAQDAYEKHEAINQKIKETFDLCEFEPAPCALDLSQKILFPDQAIYLSAKTADKKSIQDIKAAAHYILQNIDKLNLTPSFISKEEVEALLNLDLEKLRLETIQ